MRVLILFLLLTTCLFILPGPSFWYGFLNGMDAHEGKIWSLFSVKFQLFLIQIEEHSEMKQLAAHFILMMVFAFFLSKELLIRIAAQVGVKYLTIFITLIFVFIFSYFIEVIQSVLPVSFERGFDWMDIGFSLLGGFFGSAITLLKYRI